MAELNIRDLPDEVLTRLRRRATRRRRSLQAEVRDILTRAVATEDVSRRVRELQAWVDRIYKGKKPKRVVDAFIAERRKAARRGE